MYARSDLSHITDCAFGDNGDSGSNPPFDLVYKSGLSLDSSNTGSSLSPQT